MAETGAISNFGQAPDGSDVQRIELANGHASAALLTYGATLQEYRIGGVDHSLVLGGSTLAPYLTPSMRYFGAIVGRVANRIGSGRATLDGRTLKFDRNENGITTLHGGSSGSGHCNWTLEEARESVCRMSLVMPDGENGFPGNLKISATYRLDEEGALDLELEAQTDAPTFCNLAHHGYWNLDGTADLSNHRLQIFADRYLEIDGDKIPLDEPHGVSGTRFDYTSPAPVVTTGKVLDHNFCLTRKRGDFREVALLSAGGVKLVISTTEIGLQVYDGNHLAIPGELTLSGRPYGRNAGVALEPQAWPDAPNHDTWPSIVLRPGETYRQHSRFHASTA